MKKWKCTVCGYIHEGDTPPEVCPLCKAPAEKFEEYIFDEDEPIHIGLGQHINKKKFKSIVESNTLNQILVITLIRLIKIYYIQNLKYF